MNERTSVFDELDISEFKPKPASPDDTPTPGQEAIRAVSEASNFRSREPLPIQIEAANAIQAGFPDHEPSSVTQRSTRDTAAYHGSSSLHGSRLSSLQTTPTTLRREQRLYRTGRDAQLNIKSKPEIKDAFEALATILDKSFAETFEFALAALSHFTGSKHIKPETAVYLDKRLNELKRRP